MGKKIKTEVLRFFESKGSLPGQGEKEKLACPYLDLRLLDSIGIVEMVVAFEKEFDIQFTPRHLQSEAFKTVGGLVSLIEQLTAERGRGHANTRG